FSPRNVIDTLSSRNLALSVIALLPPVEPRNDAARSPIRRTRQGPCQSRSSPDFSYLGDTTGALRRWNEVMVCAIAEICCICEGAEPPFWRFGLFGHRASSRAQDVEDGPFAVDLQRLARGRDGDQRARRVKMGELAGPAITRLQVPCASRC